MKLFNTLQQLALTAALATGGLFTLAVQAQETNLQSDVLVFGPASNPGGFAGFINAAETNASQFYPAFLPAPAGIPNIGVVFFEDASQTILSDQLWIQNGFWYFASDPDTVNFQSFGIATVGALVETGAPQDVSAFFGLPAGSMQVQSDFAVPEPASGLLAGLGVGLWLLLKRPRASRH
jgi:hypothetical protein